MNQSVIQSSSSRHYWLMFALVCTFLCLPMVSENYAPLVDYPSHLARAYILSQYHNVPIYRRYYVETREILPNLAIETIVPFLLRFVGLVTASKIFLLSIILLFAFGTHALGAAVHGRPTKAAIVCMFFVYNSMLLYGFVNYLFGIGVLCVSLAAWLRWRERWSVLRLLVMGLLIFCAYSAHLTAYVFLGIAVFVVGISDPRPRRWRPDFLPLALFIPESVLYMSFHHGAVSRIAWGTFRQKIIGGLPLFLTYSHRFDLAFIAACLCILFYIVRYTFLTVVSAPVLNAGLCFLLFYLVCPHYWLGGSPVDSRFVLPAAILIVLSVAIEASQKTIYVLFSLCLILFAARVGMIWKTWNSMELRIADQVQMLSVLPEGATLYPAIATGDNDSSFRKIDRSFIHLAEMAVIERHAFVPTQPAIPGQQILLFRDPLPYRSPDRNSPDWVNTMKRYDFAWSYDLPAEFQVVLNANCDLIATKDGFSLWRVKKSPTS